MPSEAPWKTVSRRRRNDLKQQDAYWTCLSCGYEWCFYNRGSCYKCGKPKSTKNDGNKLPKEAKQWDYVPRQLAKETGTELPESPPVSDMSDDEDTKLSPKQRKQHHQDAIKRYTVLIENLDPDDDKQDIERYRDLIQQNKNAIVDMKPITVQIDTMQRIISKGQERIERANKTIAAWTKLRDQWANKAAEQQHKLNELKARRAQEDAAPRYAPEDLAATQQAATQALQALQALVEAVQVGDPTRINETVNLIFNGIPQVAQNTQGFNRAAPTAPPMTPQLQHQQPAPVAQPAATTPVPPQAPATPTGFAAPATPGWQQNSQPHAAQIGTDDDLEPKPDSGTEAPQRVRSRSPKKKDKKKSDPATDSSQSKLSNFWSPAKKKSDDEADELFAADEELQRRLAQAAAQANE